MDNDSRILTQKIWILVPHAASTCTIFVPTHHPSAVGGGTGDYALRYS